MPEAFRYPDRPPPTPTSSIVLWLMACVVLVGSVVLGLSLADRDATDTRLAAQAPSTGLGQIEPKPHERGALHEKASGSNAAATWRHHSR